MRRGWLSLGDSIIAETAKDPCTRRDAGSGPSTTPDGWRLALGLDPEGDPGRRPTLACDAPRNGRELTRDGYAYRFRPDERPLGEAEGAFLLCGFWMALGWLQQGQELRAARWFERTRAACGPPGLFSEEFDVRQRQMRGNLPQAFVHALLLECAAVSAPLDGAES